jgi:hypothetical protein
MLFKEIITVYNENQNKKIQNEALQTVKEDGSYSYRLTLKG